MSQYYGRQHIVSRDCELLTQAGIAVLHQRCFIFEHANV